MKIRARETLVARCCERTRLKWRFLDREFATSDEVCVQCGKVLAWTRSKTVRDPRTSTVEHLSQRAKTKRVDLGLDLLARRMQFGVGVSGHEIAAWCGCSHQRIFQIEKRALRKLRRKEGFMRIVREFLIAREAESREDGGLVRANRMEAYD